jgi:hypothetical protein
VWAVKEVTINIPYNFAVEEAADYRERIYGLSSERVTCFLLDLSS